MPKKIYTIGSSLRGIEEFLQLLQQHSIEVLVDVRSFPKSKLLHFCQEELKGSLSTVGIEYVYLGKELGGYRSGGYEKHMQTDGFKQGLNELEKTAKSSRTAVMCAERFPWRCHRRFISIALQQRGWEVIHIIDAKRTWQPKKLPQENQKIKKENVPKLF